MSGAYMKRPKPVSYEERVTNSTLDEFFDLKVYEDEEVQEDKEEDLGDYDYFIYEEKEE